MTYGVDVLNISGFMILAHPLFKNVDIPILKYYTIIHVKETNRVIYRYSKRYTQYNNNVFLS